MNKQEELNAIEKPFFDKMKEWELCSECGKPWNSEYHMSDECVNINEDFDEFAYADNLNDEKKILDSEKRDKE